MSEKEEINKAIKEYGEVKLYWRCVFGMSVSGLTYTVMPGAFMILSCIMSDTPAYFIALGAFLMFSGVFKALAYVIGWKAHDFAKRHDLFVKRKAYNGVSYNAMKFLPHEFDEATSLAEGLTGLFLMAIAGFVLIELVTFAL